MGQFRLAPLDIARPVAPKRWPGPTPDAFTFKQRFAPPPA